MEENVSSLQEGDFERENSERGFLFELLLELFSPKAYRAYVQTKLILEAEQAAALAKASLASRIFLKTIEEVNHQITKGENQNED